MIAKYQKSRTVLITAMVALGISLLPFPAMGQFIDDEFDRDEFVESDRDFSEGGQFGGSGFEEDATEGGRFIDEDPTGGTGVWGVTIRGRTTQLRVEREKQMLPLNVAWGAGTGLLLGGWFALIDEGDDRSTQRAIGLGAVLGALLGMTVGVKTLIAPDAPRAASNKSIEPQVMIYVASTNMPKPPPLTFGFTLRF
jgi:hypothetical protein